MRRALAGLLVAVSLGGCRMSDLAFRTDTRVDIVMPDDRATVELPVTLQWQLKRDPWEGRERGVFAVFVDRAPMAPGSDVRSLAGDDEQCRRTEGCPDAAYLATRGVYLTAETTLEVPAVQDGRPNRNRDTKDRHDATVVLLDASGRRMGEAAYRVTFYVDWERAR